MKRQRSVRVGVAAIGVLALLAVGSVRSAPTEAAWTEAEHAKSSAISAATLTAPANATCAPSSLPVLGLQSLTLTWSSPQIEAQRVQIQRGATVGTDIQGSPASGIVRTGQQGGQYQYRATYDTSKLLGLVDLTNLLGGSYTIRIYNGAGTDWISPARTFNMNVVLLGLGSSCNAA
ncbi:hypothetical protein ACW5CM_08795 [Microbacterium sp. A588]